MKENHMMMATQLDRWYSSKANSISNINKITWLPLAALKLE